MERKLELATFDCNNSLQEDLFHILSSSFLKYFIIRPRKHLRLPERNVVSMLNMIDTRKSLPACLIEMK